MHETVKLIAKVGGAGVAVAAEERPEGAPEGTRRVVALLNDLQSRGRHGGVVPGDDGEVVEMPVGGDLRPRAVDVVEQAELGERAEELAAPQPVILLLVVENDQDMSRMRSDWMVWVGRVWVATGRPKSLSESEPAEEEWEEELMVAGRLGGQRKLWILG